MKTNKQMKLVKKEHSSVVYVKYVGPNTAVLANASKFSSLNLLGVENDRSAV